MATRRKSSSTSWTGKALLGAVSVLGSGPRSDELFSDSKLLTTAARDLVLDSLYRKWMPASECTLDAIARHLPDPAPRGAHGLLDGEALFHFAEDAEALIDYTVAVDAGAGAGAPAVEVSRSVKGRKSHGAYFTPHDLAAYMVDQCLAPVLEACDGPTSDLLKIRVLDPAMGTGRFLLAAAERIAGEAAAGERDEILDLRRRVSRSCLFGIDRSGFAVRAARYLLGLFAGDERSLDFDFLRQGDSLVSEAAARDFDEAGGFPEAFFPGKAAPDAAFDAIVGNPPYVAAKNEPSSFLARHKGRSGQSDHYLLFIHKYVAKKYLRARGAVSFVVPDPLLCRGNAEGARQRLLDEVDLARLIHAKGLFPEAGVANAIFLGRRPAAESGAGDGVSSDGVSGDGVSGDGVSGDRRSYSSVRVHRLETREECRRLFDDGPKKETLFTRDVPVEFFRRSPGNEFRYLLAGGAESLLERLDTTRPPLADVGVVVRSLGSVARSRGAIFRGEEIGKEKVRSLAGGSCAGGVPILVGGESISPFVLRDDGLLIPEKAVRKDLSRYRRQKILLQKSTGRLVAALDTKGFVFPQSVYGVLVDDPRIGNAFLLAQLNSHLLNYTLHVMFTGYKLVQPQIEIEDIRRLPVIVPEFEESTEARLPSLETAKGLYRQFLDTEDPGWVLEYLEESLKLGPHKGSALIHDLLDYLGARLIDASAGGGDGKGERSPLEWLIDLMIYRICGLKVDEIELVEGFFGDDPATDGFQEVEAAAAQLGAEDPERRDPSLWRKEAPHLYGGETECTS
jgi:hypothetical protein